MAHSEGLRDLEPVERPRVDRVACSPRRHLPRSCKSGTAHSAETDRAARALPDLAMPYGTASNRTRTIAGSEGSGRLATPPRRQPSLLLTRKRQPAGSAGRRLVWNATATLTDMAKTARPPRTCSTLAAPICGRPPPLAGPSRVSRRLGLRAFLVVDVVVVDVYQCECSVDYPVGEASGGSSP
jgi:hypothetical protein